MDKDKTCMETIHRCLSAFICGCLLLAPVALADHEEDEARRRKLHRLDDYIHDLRASLAGFQALLPGAEDDARQAKKDYNEAADDVVRTSEASQAARDHHRQVKREETLLFIQLKGRLDTDDAAVAARDGVREAQEKLSVERERALAPVRQTPGYRDALAAVEAARADLRKRTEAGALPRREATLAATQILSLNRAVTLIENKTLDADEGYTHAAQALADAKAHWAETQKQITQSIRADPQRVTLARSIDDAEEASDEAQKDASRAKRARANARSGLVRSEDRVLKIRRDIDQVRASLASAESEYGWLLRQLPYRTVTPIPAPE